MKKSLLIITSIVLLVSALTLSLAKESGQTKDSTQGKMAEGGTMGKQHVMSKEQMMGSCPMCRSMMSSMMGKSLIATADGGVVVMVCNKLMKFDKDLNLVKETEMQIDMEGMQKKMMQMMEKCPMCKGMMQKDVMTEKGMK
jgi:hypothetical protein